jgi:hypothetical protein
MDFAGSANVNGTQLSHPGTVRFLTASTERLSINSSGNVTANVDIRAPIFYDSNNTGYYLDPAGTSNLRGLTLTDGSPAMTFSSTTSGRSAAFGMTDAYNMYLNAPGGGVLFLSNFQAPIMYDRDNSAYYVDPAGTSRTNYIWSGTGTYGANSTGTFGGNTSGLSGVSQVLEVRAAGAIPLMTWHYENVATRHIGLDANGFLQVYNPNEAGGSVFQANNSVRAPIFYDSNNTAYYIDPNAGSNVFGDFRVNQNGASGIQLLSTTGTQSLWIRTGYSGAPTPSVSATNVQFQSSGSSAGTFNFWSGNTLSLSILGDYAEGAGSLRAPIFYDSNNTAYYIDAASNSVLNTLTLGGRGTDQAVYYSGFTLDANTMPGNSTGFTYSVNAPFTGPIMRVGETGYSLQLNAPYGGGAALSFRTRNGDTGSFNSWYRLAAYEANPGSGNLYAAIFYDSNNTNYYVDAAGVSVLNSVAGYTLRNIEDVAVDTQYGIYFSNSYSTAYAIYREAGAWTHPYPDLRIAFHTGIKMGANPGYGGMKFYSDYDMVTQVMSINNGSDPLGGSNVYVNNSLQAGSSLRAPVFYDSDDTGYYVNFNSTDNAAMRMRGGMLLGPNPTWGAYLRVGSNGWVGDHSSIAVTNGNLHLDAQPGFALYLAWYNTSTILVGGSLTANGNITAYSDIRVKDNIETIPSALDKLDQIRGVTYTRTDRDDKERRYAGVIAQEIEQVLPEAIFENEEYKSVDYNATIGLLIQAVKELTDKVKALEAKEQ